MIRRAVLEDVPAIRAMADIAFRDAYRTILSQQQIEYMMEMMYSLPVLSGQIGSGEAVFLIEEGQGYASLRKESDTMFLLDKLYVLPEFRKTGLGRRLFDAVCDAARLMASEPAKLHLYVNRYNTAVTFYEHIGMRKAGQRDNPIGHGYYMNDYVMETDLDGR